MQKKNRKRVALWLGASAIVVVVIALSGCASGDGNGGDPSAPQNVTYRITFTGRWNRSTTGGALPIPSSAHFTSLVGTTHNSAFTMWALGSKATRGIELVAEDGNGNTLRQEVSAAKASGTADTAITVSSVGATTSSQGTFEASKAHPLLSLASMVAPTADWFVGLSGHSLLDDNGNWKSDETIMLRIYDAGTEQDSPPFTRANSAENPHKNISRLVGNSMIGFEENESNNHIAATLRLVLQQ